MTTTIPPRLQQRRRELEDLRQTHVDAVRGIDGQLTGINEAIQAYAEEAAIAPCVDATFDAIKDAMPGGTERRTRSPRRDISGIVLAFLRDWDSAPHGVDGIAGALDLRPKQVRDALDALATQGKARSDGNDRWFAVGTKPQPETTPIAPPSDAAADHGREPTLGLAQDAA
jgi:hypothetical protein